MKFKKISVFFIFLLVISFFIPNKIVFADYDNSYYVGGMSAGFSICEEGVRVIDTCPVVTEFGTQNPALDAGINKDDLILYIDNNSVNTSKDVTDFIKNKKEVNIQLNRQNVIFYVKAYPVLDITGQTKIGLILSDKINGIGTITYFHNGQFASLGHPILNNDKKILKIKLLISHFSPITITPQKWPNKNQKKFLIHNLQHTKQKKWT